MSFYQSSMPITKNALARLNLIGWSGAALPLVAAMPGSSEKTG